MDELQKLAQEIEDMMTFSSKGELFVNQLPANNHMTKFAMAVKKLTEAILEGH